MADAKKADAPPDKAAEHAADALPVQVEFTPAPELAERLADPKGYRQTPHCPECGAMGTPYEGENPHKAGTYACPACKRRYRPGADA